MARSYIRSTLLLMVSSTSACFAPEVGTPISASGGVDDSVDARSCTVDLVKGVTDCDGVEGITVSITRGSGPTNFASDCLQSRVNVDLSPGGKRARFDVTYGASVSGWTVNIGDSPTNNGGAGDSGTQSRDAEMQILDNGMSIFGNDHTVGSKLLANFSNLSLANRTIDLLVSDLRFDWSNVSPITNGFVSSPYLYALAGEFDTEGPVNYTIHAGFNRVVDDASASSRFGCGVTSFQVRVEPIVSCGDGVCSAGEGCGACPSDCGFCVSCGDGVCSAGEDCGTCPSDCGSCTSCGTCADGSTCCSRACDDGSFCI
jgi:hypothetical protein